MHPDAKFRKAADDCEIKINQLQTDRKFIRTQSCINELKNTKTTDPIDRKYRQDILDQFEDTGCSLRLKNEHV